MKKVIIILLFIVPLCVFSQNDKTRCFNVTIESNIKAPNYGLSFSYIKKHIGIYTDFRMNSKFYSKYPIMDGVKEGYPITTGSIFKSLDNVNYVFDVGLCYKIKFIILNCGIGYGYKSIYKNWYDDSKTLGNYGNYATIYNNTQYINLNLGLSILVKQRIIINTGYDTYMPGLIIGIGLRI